MKMKIRYLIILSLLSVGFNTLVKAQPSYTHPTTGLQNTYTGACMVNVCSAVYYDDGGGYSNYSNNINGVLRTFCPDNAGQAVQVYFNYFNIEGGSGCPYDFFQVINGPTQNGPVIASGCGTDLHGQTYTSTHPSGCLTFRFWSDNTTTLPGWVSILTCVPHPNGPGNGPQAGTNADCAFATGICSNSFNFTGLSTGPGLTSDGCGGCVPAENHSNWYEFTISTSGILGFTIVPNNPSVDDYDFALYQANNCSSLGSPVRCSYAATTGNTGLQTGAGDFSEDATGNGWVETISVTAGQKFYLLINEWSPNNSGFTLNWSGTATIATPKPTFVINSANYPDASTYTVCQNQSLTLYANGAGGSTFTWWNQATGGIQIGTGNTYSPSTSSAGTVTYYLQEHTASGCVSSRSAITIVVNPTNTVTGPGSATVCVNTAMPPITHTTTGATGIGTPSGLPSGVTASFSSGTITISGTPTTTGTFNYNIPLTGGCGSVNATGTIIVTTPNTVTGPGSATVCVNTAMTPITHTTTGATGIGTPTGLPSGVTASFSSGTITISGTPTAAGTFNYSIPLTGGCGSVNATGTIIVNDINVSGPGSSSACVNNAITNITHTTTGVSTMGSPVGLPSGVTASFSSGTITISGTPTVAGTYNYTIPLTGSCGTINATGTITVVTSNTVSGPNNGTACINASMPPITLTTTGATGIGTPAGLPSGVTASFSSGTITISGTPTTTGTFNYNIPLTGGCGSVNATGTITVHALPNVNASAYPNNTVCDGEEITLNGNGAQSYTWSGGVVDGVPFNQPPSTVTYTVTGTDANGCTNTSSIAITVYSNPTVSVNAVPGTIVCQGSSITLNGVGSGTSYTWSGGITDGVSFVPSSSNTYTVTTVDANNCTNSTTVNITVNPLPTVTASSNSPVCSGSDIQLIATSSSGTSCFWSGPNSFLSNNFTETIPLANELLHEGNYTVVVTDLNTSCTNSQTVFIDVVNQISSTIDPVAPVCQNEAAIQLTAANSGGTWSGPGVNNSGLFDPSVAGPGTHTITYSISGSCGSTSTADITVLTSPTATASYNNPVCENQTLVMDGNSSVSNYIAYWKGPNNFYSPHELDSIANATTNLTGTYWFYVVSNDGCKDSISLNVVVYEIPSIDSYVVSDKTCYNLNNGSIDITVNASSSYNVVWSNGAITEDLINLNEGTYTVTVSINPSCAYSQSFNITSPPALDLYLKNITQPKCGLNNGSVNLGSAGGTPPYTFTWQPNVSSDSSANQITEGTYLITLTDYNGCTDTLSINIICLPDTMIIPQLVTPNADGKNDVWEVDLSNYPNNVVKIFNRWGNLIFTANPYLPSNYWDGKVGQNIMLSLGNDYLPVGTYYYVIDLFGDGSKIYKGYIELQY